MSTTLCRTEPHETLLSRLIRFIRIAVISCMILFAALSLLENRAALMHRFDLLYYQDRCMNHALPAGTVVARVDLDNFPLAVPSPLTDEYFKVADISGIAGVNRFMDRYRCERSGSVFLHRRTSAAGERLICVGFDTLAGNDGYLDFKGRQICAGLVITIIKPATMSENPNAIRDQFFDLYQTDTAPYASEFSANVIEITAGWPDENDPALFHIPVNYYGQRNVIHFRLNDEGDHVDLVSVKAVMSRDNF